MDQLSCLKGELILIETIEGVKIEGRFHSTNSDKTRLSLYNWKELPKGQEVEDVYHLYRNQISKISKRSDNAKITPKAHVRISEDDVRNLIAISKQYVFINQVDITFHEALQDLNNFEYIALSTDGSEMGRKCKLPFLTISSPEKIYIFDIEVMQFHAFDRGLKKLLEANYPKKIVHNSRKLSDCLFHKHNVNLHSVFDTQVGDLIITKNKLNITPVKAKSLIECMTEYLGLQPDFFQEKLNILECTKRPLSSEIKETTAKNIAFLHRLSEIIHEQMLLPFTRGVEYYLEHVKSSDECQAWQLCSEDECVPKGFYAAIDY